MTWNLDHGLPAPFGPSEIEGDVNIAWFASECEAMHLLLMDEDGLAELPLDPRHHLTGRVWHVRLRRPPSSFSYGFKIQRHGEWTPLLHDPYSKELSSSHDWGKDKAYHPLSVHRTSSPFDWEGVSSPRHSLEDLVIYEMHVRGFTRHESSGVTHPGSYLGVVEKIPYLKDLGVTAVELLPVHEFHEGEYARTNPVSGAPLVNYWGYAPINFFAPMKRYASPFSSLSPMDQFRTLVRELHRHGIEVILDVVFNHTGENGHTYSFMGLAPDIYYLRDAHGNLLDYTGCGNTFNANHPIGAQLVLDCLRWWAIDLGVDGFRFDLASCLTRDRDGTPLPHPPLLEAIAEDPVLTHVKLIAEPWDAAGLYQVGHFPSRSKHWIEWNGKYRDAVRRFIKGDNHQVGEFARRITGSEDLYGAKGLPHQSLNFVTAHDGFSLYDLVSYNRKHNEENGENSLDGSSQNDSWNGGEEGVTENPDVLKMRSQQARNLLLALMVSRGIPMLVMGDEYLHTRMGNNNPWCQDNELNWFLWDRAQEQEEFLKFTQQLLLLRQRCSLLRHTHFLTDGEVDWHGVNPFKPDWGSHSHFLAFTLKGENPLYLAFNTHSEPLTVCLPNPPEEMGWRLLVDSGKGILNDVRKIQEAPVIHPSCFLVPAHSSMLLIATD